MSLFDDKYNNRNNRKSMGEDLLDGIGSSLPLAKELSEKITGHTIEGDMKINKGFTDEEFAGMSVEQLMKLKRKYRSRSVIFIPLAVILLIAGISAAVSGNDGASSGVFSIIIGVVALVLALKAKSQCKMIQKHLDVDK